MSTNLLLFCTLLTINYNGVELKELASMNKLATIRPNFGILLTIAFLNMGGLPPTLGFFGKFYIFLEVSLRND